MTELPKKITDDPYGAAILIRRLIMEQGAAYWRRYLLAFVLMAVSAGDHRRLGLPARPGHQPGLCRQERPRHRDPVRRHRRDLHPQGSGDLRSPGDPVEDLQRHPRQQPAPAVRQADERKRRLLLRTAFVRISGAPDGRRQFRHAGPQPADQRRRTRSAVADRADRRDGDAGSRIWRCSGSRWRRRRCWCCASW